MIKPNDFQYSEKDNKVIDDIKNEILSQLEKDGIAYVYACRRWRAESYDRIVGERFKKAGYYVAYDYIPNGYRNIIVSKMPIGAPTGMLVSRVYE
jgi:hypothetical protein